MGLYFNVVTGVWLAALLIVIAHRTPVRNTNLVCWSSMLLVLNLIFWAVIEFIGFPAGAAYKVLGGLGGLAMAAGIGLLVWALWPDEWTRDAGVSRFWAEVLGAGKPAAPPAAKPPETPPANNPPQT